MSVVFLKDRGAVLESANEVTNILLPKDLSSALDVEEYISLAKKPEDINPEDKDTYEGSRLYPIQFQTPLLDKIISMAGSKPPFLQTTLKFNYIKTQGFDNLIKEQFEFIRSKISVSGTGETKTRYILLTSRFLAQSDEQKEGLLDLSFNIDTGAIAPGMLSMLYNAEKQYPTKVIPGYTKEEITQTVAALAVTTSCVKVFITLISGRQKKSFP